MGLLPRVSETGVITTRSFVLGRQISPAVIIRFKTEESHLVRFIKWIFSKENLWALLLALIILLLFVVTAGTAPLWIYQGF